MKRILFLLLCSAMTATAQSSFEWNDTYKLQLSDFRSPITEINGGTMYSIKSGGTLSFAYQMTNAEFMFTKNFNSKVSCTFQPESAVLIAPDSTMANHLLDYARVSFDLCELYARRFRKKLYEEKGTFSDFSFAQPLFDDIQRQYDKHSTLISKQSDLGRNKEILKTLHDEIIAEIQQLPDFCKACKPNKKKK